MDRLEEIKAQVTKCGEWRDDALVTEKRDTVWLIAEIEKFKLPLCLIRDWIEERPCSSLPRGWGWIYDAVSDALREEETS